MPSATATSKERKGRGAAATAKPGEQSRAPSANRSGDVTAKSDVWPHDRIDLAQAVWGEGQIGPAGASILGPRLPALALDPTMTVVEIGAGLGAISRQMHLTAGVYTLGYEPDPSLRQRAELEAARWGFQRKTRYAPFDPADPALSELRPNSVDRIVLHSVILGVADPKRLLDSIAAACAPDAQMLFADTFLAEGRVDQRALRRWREAQVGVSYLTTWSVVREWLMDLGFELHVEADESKAYCSAISKGWTSYLERLSEGELTLKSLGDALIECKRWKATRQAIKAGALEYRSVTATFDG